jgi:predicted ATP-binding protein involved in virulence
MQISQLKLENYACFKALDIKLATKNLDGTGSSITVIVGNNGSGKTNILNAIATGLSWFIAKMKDEEAEGYQISEKRIRNETDYGSIAFINNMFKVNDLKLSLTSVRKNAKTDEVTNNANIEFWSLSDHLDDFMPTEKRETDQPIVAYYGIGRRTVDKTIFEALEPKSQNLT